MNDRPVVGVIGLGTMGLPMALNLTSAGLAPVVFDVRPAAVDQVVAAGGSAATSVAELARRCDVIFVVVVDETQFDHVVGSHGEAGGESSGILGNASAGTVVLVNSTIGPQACRTAAQRLELHGIHLLDAPITGGPAGARDGTLAVIVGGPADQLDHCRYALDVVAAQVVWVGDVGAGQLAKLANNLVLAATLRAVHEALALCAQFGIDRGDLLQVLGAGAADSWVVQHWADIGASSRGYPGGVRGVSRLTVKDLTLALTAGRDIDLPLPLTALTSQLLADAYKAAAETG